MKRQLIVIATSLMAYTATAQEGKLVDKRDSLEYATITVNGQEWMAENLKFKIESSLDVIGQMNDTLDTRSDAEKTGYYYAIVDINKVIPEGWRIPTQKDLINLWGTYCTDPTSMFPSADAIEFITGDAGGTNSTGFSATKYGSFNISDMRGMNTAAERSKNTDASSFDAFSSAIDAAEGKTYSLVNSNDHGWYFKDDYGDIKYFYINGNNKFSVSISSRISNAYFIRLVRDN